MRIGLWRTNSNTVPKFLSKLTFFVRVMVEFLPVKSCVFLGHSVSGLATFGEVHVTVKPDDQVLGSNPGSKIQCTAHALDPINNELNSYL